MTPKQARFVEEYLVDLNATQAFIRAGYTARGNAAEVNAARLLRKAQVQSAISEAMQARRQRTEVTADRVVKELARLAFLDPGKLFNADGAPLRVADLDEDTRRALAGLDVVAVGNSDVGVGQVLKLKLADKPRVLELLMRHLGMFTEKIELTGKDGGPVHFYLPSNGR
jgi:phage terminase small subunit